MIHFGCISSGLGLETFLGAAYNLNPAGYSTRGWRPLDNVCLRMYWLIISHVSQLATPSTTVSTRRGANYRWSRSFWWWCSIKWLGTLHIRACMPVCRYSYFGMHVFCTTGCWDPWGQNTLALASTAQCHYCQCVLMTNKITYNGLLSSAGRR